MQSHQTSAAGKLFVGGDWACANGDLDALADVARRLAGLTRGPLHGELLALVDACRRDPDRASAAWIQLKPRVQHSLR